MRWAVLLALAATAHAAGKFLSTAVLVAEIPDQQAILAWKGGRERLLHDKREPGPAAPAEKRMPTTPRSAGTKGEGPGCSTLQDREEEAPARMRLRGSVRPPR